VYQVEPLAPPRPQGEPRPRRQPRRGQEPEGSRQREGDLNPASGSLAGWAGALNAAGPAVLACRA
jgi:hypothetical protein